MADLGAALIPRPHGDWYAISGVWCRVGHTIVAGCEQHLARVLEAHDPDAEQEPLAGLLRGIPLYRERLIRGWQARAAASLDGLARSTVERHLRFLPVRRAPDYLAARDARLWFRQALVENSLNILGVLAALNRRYSPPFQFKRTRKFVGELRIAPPDVAARVERLLTDQPAAAALALEALVGETVALVEAHMPDVDTPPARQDLGHRQRPWKPGRLEAR